MLFQERQKAICQDGCAHASGPREGGRALAWIPLHVGLQTLITSMLFETCKLPCCGTGAWTPALSGRVTVGSHSTSLPQFPICKEGGQQWLPTTTIRPTCEKAQIAHSSWLVSNGGSFISFTVLGLYTCFNCNLARKSPFGFSFFFDFLFAYEFSCAS